MKNLDTSDASQLLSRRETANLLRVHPRTILRYERAGLLNPIRLNCRVTRYKRAEVEQLIANSSADGSSAATPDHENSLLLASPERNMPGAPAQENSEE